MGQPDLSTLLHTVPHGTGVRAMHRQGFAIVQDYIRQETFVTTNQRPMNEFTTREH